MKNNIGKDDREIMTNNRRMLDSFLNFCRKEEIEVILEMNNSYTAEGLIVGFDQYSIVLDIFGSQQIFFLTSMCCIKPKEEVNYIFNEAYRYKKTLKGYSKYASNYS